MANDPTSPDKKDEAPAPQEAELASSVSKPVAAEPIPVRGKFDPLRPLRYAFSFVTGTVKGALNGMATAGRKGMWLGAGIGLLSVMSGVVLTGGVSIFIGAVFGLLTGALAGTAVGAVTGGVNEMGREARKNKYSDDLLEKAQAKSRPGPRVDYRAAHREHKLRTNYSIDRIMHQQRENAQDTGRFFQNLVEHSRMGNHERGY